MTKELNAILESIQKYCEKYKGNVQFVGSFMAFKGKDCDVVDGRILAYGFKDTLLIDLEELQKQIKKEKEDFVNW